MVKASVLIGRSIVGKQILICVKSYEQVAISVPSFSLQDQCDECSEADRPVSSAKVAVKTREIRSTFFDFVGSRQSCSRAFDVLCQSYSFIDRQQPPARNFVTRQLKFAQARSLG